MNRLRSWFNKRKRGRKMREKVLKLLQESCPDIDFLSSKSLVDDGELDSLSTAEIISVLAMDFGVEVPYEELTADNFNSLDAIVALVEKYS